MGGYVVKSILIKKFQFLLLVLLMESVVLQGGAETKTLTPKQCLIIDAGLETIKVGGATATNPTLSLRSNKCLDG